MTGLGTKNIDKYVLKRAFRMTKSLPINNEINITAKNNIIEFRFL